MKTSLFLICCYIIFILPKPLRTAWGYTIGILWFDVFRIRRKIAIENVARAFPDWPKDKVIATARRSLIEQGYLLSDFAEMAFITKENLMEKVKIKDRHYIDQALKENKGAFLLALHMSNGDYGIASLAAHGFPLHLITKRFKSKWLDDLWFKIRGRFGTRFINDRSSSFDILKAVKANEVVIFVLDQFMGPPHGVKTTFFGHPTGTAFGLALFARKTQAPVIPTYAQRLPDGSLLVTCLPPVLFEEKNDKDATLQFMTQKYTDTIEEIVKTCPEQWLWIHRRWKSFNA
ncbi:MAG: lysophospholipid acyltransferase family protein [Bdellovibrionaceae bacterium]|nr:lysophospholipid acyltransferase family protein [Pseudobdellovibrionaceae bacterium]